MNEPLTLDRLRSLATQTSGVARRLPLPWRVALLALWLGIGLRAATAQEKLVFACGPENDLYRIVQAEGGCSRFDGAAAAVEAAREGGAVLLLADRYPQETTTVEPAVLEKAEAKRLRLYVEYPAALPNVEVGLPQQDRLARGVVSSEWFGPDLPPLRIVTINDCRFVPLKADRPHLVLAKVAGVDRAVFGLTNTPSMPLLVEQSNRLMAATALSRFVHGRYMPEEGWRIVWRRILTWLAPSAPVPALRWLCTVRPSYRRDEPLPEGVESLALTRAADWVTRSRILRHPQWPRPALDWALTYNTVREMPAQDWPTGDGSFGLLEGFSSTIRADGSQPMRYAVRNDCLGETAMLLALSAEATRRLADGQMAANLVDYALLKSGLAAGPRADSTNAAFGLIGWALDSPNSYWGDDNARAWLGMTAVSALRRESRWAESLERNLLANLRTSGTNGHRPRCLTQADLDRQGWRHYGRGATVENTPHMTSWLLACFALGHARTGYQECLLRAEAGCRTLVEAYPNWDYVNDSRSIELARVLLPLAWLVRAQDTPEHRRWLRRFAGELAALQDSSGAIRESIRLGRGAYRGCIPTSNQEYGTRETSLIQEEGDAVADMLYTCNFAFIGLHEAAVATGDPFYAEVEDRLARFLCRIQIRSEAHPELDGAWYRAFHYRHWEFWASNADWEWGPWCTESGWTQPWIAGTFALRQLKTSLWDLARKAPASGQFERWRSRMIPDPQ